MYGTLDDFKRLRAREEAQARIGLGVRPDDPPSFLGQVASPTSKIGVGRFLLVYPVTVLGNEVEGGAGSISVDATTTVPVYLIGPAVPAQGEYLICRFVGHRWVADRANSSAAAVTPISIGIPGCFCQGTPSSLTLTVNYADGENSHTYGNAYQNCVLAYYVSNPPYIPQAAFPGAGYYSTSAWVDDYGFTDYFRLSCFSTQYTLGIGQFSGGLWQSPGQIYNWAVGGRPAVNFCSPFLLAVGHTQPGIYFNGTFVVSG